MMRRVLAAVLFTGTACAGLSPSAVEAQDYDPAVIDLVVGGEGATPWSIGGVMPCQTGTRTVTLHNAGSANGTVTIWISDIVSEEGLQPVSETGDTEEPGELDDHLLLGLSADAGMDANIAMPTGIHELPQSTDDPNYIRVSPLNSGATATLTWDWELPCGTGNDTQGDDLSFTINYALVEVPEPEPPQPPAPIRWAAPTSYDLEIDMLGESRFIRIGRGDGATFDSYSISDADDTVFLQIDRFTSITCGDCVGCGNALPSLLVLAVSQNSPPSSTGIEILSPVYEFTGFKGLRRDVSCPSVTFGKPVVFSIDYDADNLPGNITDVFIGYYDTEGEEWVELSPDAGQVAQLGVATGLLTHLSTFAVIARTGSPVIPGAPSPAPTPSQPEIPSLEPTPAHFLVRDLSVIPSERFFGIGTLPFMIEKGKSATVIAKVTNDGGQSGSYNVMLMLNGNAEAETEIVLSPGQTREVILALSDNRTGNNSVQIGDLRIDFITTRWYNWPLIAGLSITLGFVVWIIGRRMNHRGRRVT